MTRLTASEIARISAENRKRWNTAIPDPLDDSEQAGKRKAKKAPRIARNGARRVSESEVLRGCMAVLESHPRVALWWRQNTGAVKVDGKRFVRFSFTGASDLMAVLEGGDTGGRFLAVECKATGKKASHEQQAFLDNVLDAGGWATCVDSPAKLTDYLRALR